MQSTAHFDRAAVTFSLACVAHCVALPVIAIALPFIAALAEAEWVHWLLTALAVFASSSVIMSSPSARTGSFLVPAICGLVLVTGALFAERLGVEETIPTVIGGVLLAVAHIRRLAA